MNRLEFLQRLVVLAGAAGWARVSALPHGGTPPARNVWVLNKCWIAGFNHHRGEEVRGVLRTGMELELRAEFENPHDWNAIALDYRGVPLGYVPRAENRHLARLIRQGARLRARVLTVNPAPEAWQAVRVEIAVEA
jgi:hypothetical protein